MLKIALLLLLVVLICSAGGQRLRALISTTKKLPRDFKKAKLDAEDPVAAAKEVPRR